MRTSVVSKPARYVSAVFGLFLIGVGVRALFVSEAPLHWVVLAVAAMVLLGANLIYSAFSGKPSWLSRIGPLP